MHEINLPGDALADLAGEILRSGGAFSFRANGSSMYPFLPNGTILTVIPVHSHDLGVGDIVLYRIADRLIVHRIVNRATFGNRTFFGIRGDNCTGSPHRVTGSDVLGLVSCAAIGPLKIAVSRMPWRFVGILWARAGIGPFIVRTLHRAYLLIKKQ